MRDEHLSASRKAVNKQSSLFLKIFAASRLVSSQGEQPADCGSAVSRDEQHSVLDRAVNTTSSTFLKILRRWPVHPVRGAGCSHLARRRQRFAAVSRNEGNVADHKLRSRRHSIVDRPRGRRNPHCSRDATCFPSVSTHRPLLLMRARQPVLVTECASPLAMTATSETSRRRASLRVALLPSEAAVVVDFWHGTTSSQGREETRRRRTRRHASHPV